MVAPMDEAQFNSKPIGPDSPQAAAELLPLVYHELRRLAAARLAREKPGQTLQATALVHEAWLRVADSPGQSWQSKAHFFGAAAEAMRRILVENARRKKAVIHGGGLAQTTLATTGIAAPIPDEQLLAVDEALEALSQEDPQAAQLVKLRFFIGLPHREAAEVLGLSHTKADRTWLFAKARLAQALEKG
jgi:RNA polymerase sigma factor (TIGR02999 family)